MQTHAWKGISIALFALLAVFVGGNIFHTSASAQTSCPVSVKSPIKTADRNAVYYVTESCTRIAIRSPHVYFSHFSSWNAIQTVSASVMNSIPVDSQTFLEWGPRRTYKTGSLIKSPDSPDVFVLVAGRRYTIGSAELFNNIRLNWQHILDVTDDVLEDFPHSNETLREIGDFPAGMPFKYENSPRVFTVVDEDGMQKKQHVPTYEDLVRDFDISGLAIIPDSVNFPDAVVSYEPQEEECENYAYDGSCEEDDDDDIATGPVCGNGIKETGEYCDDGALNGRAGECNAACSEYLPVSDDDDCENYAYDGSCEEDDNDDDLTSGPVCGNGVRETGEFCDDGSLNGQSGECSASCSEYLPVETNDEDECENYAYDGSCEEDTDDAGQTGGETNDDDDTSSDVDGGPSTPLVPYTGNSPELGLALGTNVGGVNYWATEWMFKDLFKMAVNASNNFPGPWVPWNYTGDSNSLDLDADGWIRGFGPGITGASAYFMHTGDPNAFPSGQYIVLYNGEGQIYYDGDATLNQELSTPGRHVLDVNYTGAGVNMNVLSSDPNNTGNYLRDIAFLMPGGTCGDQFTYAATPSDCPSGYVPFEQNYRSEPFHPQYLSDLSPYSAIRFMAYFDGGLMYARNVDWNNRVQVTDASYSGGGSIEAAVDMVNILDADFWYNLPVAADDYYITQAARVIHGRLDTDQNVIVELGNEVWNYAAPFAQGTQYAVDQGVARWGAGDEFTKGINWYGMRSAQACQIFRQEFGADSDRVECVIANQAANSWLVEQAVTCPYYVQEGGTPCYNVVDAIATAPYMHDPGDNHSSVSDIITALRNDLDTTASYMRQNKAVADRYGLEYHAYEGGQHLVDYNGDTPLQQLYHDANRSQQMANLYNEYFTRWENEGGDLFMHFLNAGPYSRYGAWGAMEYQGQQNAPKYQALQQVSARFGN